MKQLCLNCSALAACSTHFSFIDPKLDQSVKQQAAAQFGVISELKRAVCILSLENQFSI
jgi:hypothetical protein